MAEALANGPLPPHIEIMTMHDWCERVMAISGRKIPLLPGTLNGPTQDSLRQLTYRHSGTSGGCRASRSPLLPDATGGSSTKRFQQSSNSQT